MASSTADDDNTLAARIGRALAARIVSGALAPDERLRQDGIALEFNASHVPVREAFRRLEAQGLVVSEPRKGVRVAALDPATVMEVTQMRAALETLALRNALPRLDAAHLAAARGTLREGQRSTELLIWEATNRRFHRTLVEPCGMPRLLAAIDDLHAVSSRFLHATWQRLDWGPRSEQEHEAILAAIERKDAEAAAGALAAHILAAGEALTRALTHPDRSRATPAGSRPR